MTKTLIMKCFPCEEYKELHAVKKNVDHQRRLDAINYSDPEFTAEDREHCASTLCDKCFYELFAGVEMFYISHWSQRLMYREDDVSGISPCTCTDDDGHVIAESMCAVCEEKETQRCIGLEHEFYNHLPF